MFKIFDEKCKEYGLEEKNLFIESKSISPIEYSTKQEVSFNLSERKNYKTYEYAVKWISSSKNISDQTADDDIYIVWPIKESKCRALTLSTSDFKRTYKNNGLQTIHKKSNIAEYDVWLFKKKYIDEFFQTVIRKMGFATDSEEIDYPFVTTYNEGGKTYVLDSHYERDSKLREAVINRFQSEHNGKLFCSICGFDFAKRYGEYGSGFIEVHHTKPLSEDERASHQATVDELICVCSNCHRMLHHKRPAMKPDDLKKIIVS